MIWRAIWRYKLVVTSILASGTLLARYFGVGA